MCLVGVSVANREYDWGCLNHMDLRNLWSKCGVILYCWIFPNCLMYHTNKANTPHPSMQSTQFDEEGVPRPHHRRTRKHTTGPWRLVCSTKTGESTVPVLEYGVRYGAGHIYSDPFFQRMKLWTVPLCTLWDWWSPISSQITMSIMHDGFLFTCDTWWSLRNSIRVRQGNICQVIKENCVLLAWEKTLLHFEDVWWKVQKWIPC